MAQRLSRNGFIKPNGEFVSVPAFHHGDYAEEQGTSKDALVFRQHWIPITRDEDKYFFLDEIRDGIEKKKPTQAQIDTLFDWAKKYKAMDWFKEFMKMCKEEE